MKLIPSSVLTTINYRWQGLNLKQKIALSTVLVLAASLLLLPARQNPDQLRALYQQGNYMAAQAGLQQALKKDPKWHEGRYMLADIELKSGRPVAALEHMIILSRARQNIAPLASRLSAWYRTNPSDPQLGRQTMAVILGNQDQLFSHSWLRGLGLRLSFFWCPEDAPQFFQAMGAVITEEDKRTISNFIEGLHSAGEWETLWQIATSLDQQLINTDRSYRNNVFSYFYGSHQPEKWRALQERFPEDSLIAAGWAFHGGGGLAWLRNWEGNRQVSKDDEMYYSLIKSRLVNMAAEIHPEDLTNILPGYLWDAARREINFPTSPNKLEILLSHLAGVIPEAESDALKRASKLGRPTLSWTGNSNISHQLSPEGSLLHLEYSPGNLVIIDLDINREYQYTGEAGKITWSPDGNLFVTQDNTVFNAKGQRVADQSLFQGYTVLGWRDKDHLWLSRRGDYYQYAISSGALERISSISTTFEAQEIHPGPGGSFLLKDSMRISIWDGVKTREFSYSHGIQRATWLPQGTGVIIQMNYKPHLQHLSGDLVQLDLPRDTEVLGWRNDNEAYVRRRFSNGDSELGIYNLSSGQLSYPGILNPRAAADNRVVSESVSLGWPWEPLVYKVMVHKLP